MSAFATYNIFDKDRRTAVRIEDGGQVEMLITDNHGDIVRAVSGVVDSARASGIVHDARTLTADLPDMSGEFSIGIGEEDSAPELHVVKRARLPAVLAFEEDVRAIAAELQPILPAPEPVEEVQQRDFVMWMSYFTGAHLALGTVILLGTAVAVVAMQWVGYALGALAFLAVLGVAYRDIGSAMGRAGRSAADAFVTAAVAVVIPSLLMAYFGGGTAAVVLGIALPFAAAYGASAERQISGMRRRILGAP